MCAVQRQLHAHRGALQHGHPDRPVHTRQADALPAAALQGTALCSHFCKHGTVQRCSRSQESTSQLACICTLGSGPIHTKTLWLQVDIFITPGAHSTEAAVNKQLNDKERVAAALENPNLLDMVNRSLQAKP